MVKDRVPIHLTAVSAGSRYELQTYQGEYRNLMVLLFDKIYTEDFGECRGMGRCGTCVVKVEGLAAEVNAMDRNERGTLSKMAICGADLRLACQILVDENLENATVEVMGCS